MNSDILADLAAYLHTHVPVSRGFALEFRRLDDRGLWSFAPLDANANDKGTAFAGSLASVLTLSGWAMLNVLTRAAELDADVAVTRSEIDYRRPVRGDIEAVCLHPESRAHERFLRVLRKTGKAKLTLEARIGPLTAPDVALRASYAAVIRQSPLESARLNS